MSDSKVTPAWNFKGMLMENNSRVITNADATLTQKIYDYGEVSPEQSSVTVVKDDDMAHFYFNICSEKGEPAYIKITKDNDGNIVITGTDHSGTTQQTLLASKIELTENDKGVLISVLATENGELIKKEAQVYDSMISVEEKDYGALVTMTNSKGTSSETKLYSPSLSAERLEDNTGVKITITPGKEGATPTVVNLYEPTIEGKRVTGGAEITIKNHIDEDPTIINLYDAGSESLADEFDSTKTYQKDNFVTYNNNLYKYISEESSTGEFDETKWRITKVGTELEDLAGNKLVPATSEILGGIKVGNNLSIEEDGTLSANADLSIVAEEWDKTKIYSIGDYVLYQNILYKCINEVKAGWDYSAVNNDYVFNTAGEVLLTNGYTYTKGNSETAYGGYTVGTTNFSNPILLSETAAGAYVNRSGGSAPAAKEITIYNKTFYFWNEWGHNGSPSSPRAKLIEYNSDNVELGKNILKAAGISYYGDSLDPASNSNWKKVLVMDEIKNKQSTVPIASAETAGIVKVGENLEITEDGTLNAKAGGGNANEMELTWAEYEALSDEEKNNGTTYYITDKNPIEGTTGFKATLLATLSDSAQTIDFDNYDLILYQVYNSDNNLYNSAIFLPSYLKTANSIILPINVTDRIVIDSTNAITTTGFNCVASVYGLKSNSLNDNETNGLHVYSSDEKLIGTWIDGSKVYEKTISHEGNIATGGTIDHGVSNLKEIISSTCSIKRSGSFIWESFPIATSNQIGRYTINSSQIEITTTWDEFEKIIFILKYTKEET